EERGEGEASTAPHASAPHTTGERPPSTLIAVPVMYDPWSDASKQARLANSSAVPMRPSGVPLARFLANTSKSVSGAVAACRLTYRSLMIRPTSIALTRMLCSPPSLAITLVSAMPAARVTEVGADAAAGALA